jgi:hypothetical protein
VRILLLSLIMGLALVEFPADAEEKTGVERPAAEQARRPPAPILLSVEVVPDPPVAPRTADAGSEHAAAAPDRATASAHQDSTDSTAPRPIAR